MDDLENLKFEDILKFIKGMDYGEIVLTIHDSQVVQVEKREKKRFKSQKRLQEQSQIVKIIQPTGQPEA